MRGIAAACLATMGCSEPSPAADAGADECGELPAFVGSSVQPPDLEIIAVQPDGSFVPILDGDEVAIRTPLDGGKVMLVGALVTNVSLADCGRLRIGALLRDPTDPEERVAYNEERHVRYEPMADRPFWAMPMPIYDVRNMGPNLETCGFSPYPRDVDGCEWILELRLEDTRTEDILVSERVRVTPVCLEDDPGAPSVAPELELALCQCQCAANYEPGRCDTGSLPDWIDPPLDCE